MVPFDWQARGACRGCNPEIFFPERGESTREAKAICRGCGVREECLEYALAAVEKFGIWGGLSERERRRIRRQRREGSEADGRLQSVAAGGAASHRGAGLCDAVGVPTFGFHPIAGEPDVTDTAVGHDDDELPPDEGRDECAASSRRDSELGRQRRNGPAVTVADNVERSSLSVS
jgi:WhiB family redox-sensing transcriptional regulator